MENITHIPAFIAIFDNQFNFIELSNNFAKALGYENNEPLIGQSLSKLVEAGEKGIAILHEGLILTNGTFQTNLPMRGKENHINCVAKFSHVLVDNSIDRIYAVFENLTQSDKSPSLQFGQSETIRFDQNRPLLQIMEATNSTIWEYDFTRKSMDLQNPFLKFLRVSPQENTDLFESMALLVHPNDETILTDAINALSINKGTQNFTARFRDNDGGWRWLNITGCVTQWNYDETPKLAHGLINDITRTVNLETSIKEFENTLNVVSVLSGTCHFEIDLFTGRMDWSKSAKRVFETGAYYQPICVENFLNSFFENDAANQLRQTIDNVLFSQIEFTIELPIKTAQGNKKWLEFFGTPKFEGKEVIGLVGAFRDISEKIETSVALADALHNAQKASDSKSLFLANMSHEIRTPLNGVLGIAAALKRTALNNEQTNMVDIILTSGKNLGDLLNDILDFSKIESGQISLELIDAPAREIVDNVHALFSQSAREKNIDFILENNIPDDMLLFADPTRIKQIVSNLVGNAIKFTNNGSVTIKAGVSQIIGQNRAKLRFEVKDTGKGFDETYKALIFDRFTQAEASINRKFGGTGLGLSICKSLANLMDGTLDAHSENGKGATFWFEAEFETKKAKPRQIEKEVTPQFDSMVKILAAEDNKINQTVLELLLREFDMEITFANDGNEAFDAYQKQKFDLVLMDTQMPVMDGLEATRHIRAFEAQNGQLRTPIITLSANVMKEQIEDAKAAGADDYISKPIDAKDLFAKIAKWLIADENSEAQNEITAKNG